MPAVEPATHSQQLTSHLAELRYRIINMVVGLVIGTGLGFLGAEPVIQLLQVIAPSDVQFVQLTPGEVLGISVKLACFIGIGLSSPWMLYHLLRFIFPGLTNKEKRFALLSLFLGSGLFLAGVLFAYLTVLSPALTFLMDFGRQIAIQQISIASYVEFCLSVILLVGITFELPVVLISLSLVRIVRLQQLISQWRTVVIAIFFAAAVLTPSQDPITMILVGGALLLLYAMSLIPIYCIEKARQPVSTTVVT